MQTFIPCKLICTKITDCILPSSAQAQAPDWLSSIIIAEGNPTGHPEKYNFQARAILGSSLASWELLYWIASFQLVGS